MKIVSPRFRTGDLLCDIDSDEFARTCRVRLFPDNWNVWRIFINSQLSENPDTIATIAAVLVNNAIKDVGGILHDFEAVVSEPISAGQVPIQLPATFGDRRKSQDWLTNCDWPQTRLRSNVPWRSVAVRFVYRGASGNAPWPSMRVSSIGIKVYCPVEADALLDSVWEPIPDESVPDVPAVLDDIPDSFPSIDIPSLPSAGEIGSGLAKALWPVMFLAGSVAIIAIAKD